MMKSKELRKKAWDSLKGKYWMAFAVILVTGLISSVGNSFVSFGQNLSEVLGLVDPSEMDSTMMVGALVLNGVVIVSAIIGLIIYCYFLRKSGAVTSKDISTAAEALQKNTV